MDWTFDALSLYQKLEHLIPTIVLWKSRPFHRSHAARDRTQRIIFQYPENVAAIRSANLLLIRLSATEKDRMRESQQHNAVIAVVDDDLQCGRG